MSEDIEQQRLKHIERMQEEIYKNQNDIETLGALMDQVLKRLNKLDNLGTT